jgi:HK97 family phage major capsid protein/HK97 family phage prohead protease
MLPNRAYSVIRIKSVREDQRVIEGIASTPTVDREGDIIEPMGAKFSLPIPLLFQHRAAEPVGEVTTAKATKDGLSFVAKFAQLDEPGRLKDRLDEAWQSVKIGLVKGVSIGFLPIEYSFIDDGGVRFTEWDWLELSLVTIPANQDTTIQTVKSIDAELLAAIGREQSGRTTRPGATGIALPVVKGRRTMARKTIAEQIAAFEATRQAKAARMTEIMDDSSEKGETLDAAQTEEYDGLAGEVKSIDDHLVRLHDQEKMSIAAAKPINGNTPESGSAARAGVTVTSMQRQLPKGIAFTRYAMCLMAAKGNMDTALKIAEARYPDMDDMHLVLRAAVAAGTTSDPAWAGPLVQYSNLTSDFIEFLRPMTIVGRFGTGVIPPLRAVPFNVRIPRGTAGGHAYWVGEGQPKPVTSMAMDSVTMRWAKAATIAVITQELARFSSPSAESYVREELSKAIAERLDIDFVDPAITAVADTRPASITNGVVATPSSGPTAEDARVDIETLYGKFLANGLVPTNGVWIMNNMTALSLSMMRNALGQKEFPDINMIGGTLEGLPVITSEYVATAGTPAVSNVILAIASEIMLADDDGVTVDASTEASLEMDGAPSGSGNLVSLWQTNSIGIRAERFINWLKRRAGAVEYLSGVAYSGAVTGAVGAGAAPARPQA